LPKIALARDDFPEALGPIIPTISPLSIFIDIPLIDGSLELGGTTKPALIAIHLLVEEAPYTPCLQGNHREEHLIGYMQTLHH